MDKLLTYVPVLVVLLVHEESRCHRGGQSRLGGRLSADPWLDPIRMAPSFAATLEEAEHRQREALAAFTVAEGHRLLGMPAA
jgi:hypothetical protein